MAPSTALLLLVALVAMLAPSVSGHGMVIDPVNRGSMWRYGYNTPRNYEDDEQFCGGIAIQWEKNGGKCGECGDDYSLPRPRPAENTGKYGTGQVVKTYVSGETITVTVKLTANHKGGFRFHLCPLTQRGALETEECFQKYPLKMPGGGTYYALPSHSPGEYIIDLKLPQGVKCEQCVLRWSYKAANNWGNCEDGSSGMGCGPQETYRTCSDVKIV